jgi:putative membrane protein
MNIRLWYSRNVLNWKVILVSLLVNTLVIAVTVLLLPGIRITAFRFGTFFLLAIGLGLLQTFIKPILQLITIRLLFVTYGLVLVVMNALLLWLLSRFSDVLVIDSLLAALLGGFIIGILGTFLDYLFGVIPPLGYGQALREEEGSA